MERDEVEQIVQEMLKDYFSDSLADQGKVSNDQRDFLINNKVDARNIVDYTFAGTGAETFEHLLGRIPKGFIVLNQTQSARISGDITTWTTKRVTLTSSVANNQVRILFL